MYQNNTLSNWCLLENNSFWYSSVSLIPLSFICQNSFSIKITSMLWFDSLSIAFPPDLFPLSVLVLQEKINKFLIYKRHGRSFNAEVRNRKDYRNPDFLLHAVRYQDIDQIGSCFSKDVFDPHGYDKSDFYDEIGDFSFHCVFFACMDVCLHFFL